MNSVADFVLYAFYACCMKILAGNSNQRPTFILKFIRVIQKASKQRNSKDIVRDSTMVLNSIAARKSVCLEFGELKSGKTIECQFQISAIFFK